MGELFGRDHDLLTLRSALRRAFTGRGGLVLISGEPGIGKTDLLDHLAYEVHGLGGRAAWGTCWNGEGTPALRPWQRVLSTFDDNRPDVLGELRTRAESEGGDLGQFALFTGVSEYLRSCARVTPLLVMLDDLQWADAGCLRLLRFVARDLRGDPILLTGAFRGGALPDGHLLRDLAADSSTLHVQFTGLTDDAVAAMLADAAGASPTPATVARVTERTAGNPFFVREVAHLLATEPASPRLPAAVEDAVASASLRSRRPQPPCWPRPRSSVAASMTTSWRRRTT